LKWFYFRSTTTRQQHTIPVNIPLYFRQCLPSHNILYHDNCIIVDDEAHAIDVLQHHIKSIPQLNLIASFTKPTEAITFLSGQQVDLIFLDIHMPEISGIEFIQTVRHENYHFILTTAYREFAPDGFDLDVVDYLIKPIPLTRFLQAVTKAQKAISQSKTDWVKNPIETEYFMVKGQIKGKMIKINLIDIDYIEGMKNYVAFHHNETYKQHFLETIKKKQII
jgi:two-component system, LytTR family, response regulator